MLVDIMKITKDTEAFYLSGNKKGILNVQITNPINNNINITITRESSFDKTLQGVFTKIKIYLDNLFYININDGSTIVTGISNDINGVKEFIKYYRMYSYRKYLCGTGISGELRIT